MFINKEPVTQLIIVLLKLQKLRLTEKLLKLPLLKLKIDCVYNTVKELELDQFENINYIRGLKNLVGMK
jgi:hypothetical protein